MESIRRKIKIFWLEHRDPILLYSGVIIGIILVVQFLNQMAIEKKKAEQMSNTNITNEEIYTYNIKDETLIEDFIEYCKENKTEEAYELLSKKCKEELYQTHEIFVNEYYSKIFNKKKIIEINYEKEKKLYEIVFYSDVLESGGFKNHLIDYYKIESDVIENKIYINFYKEIK